jgi:hypothetical protein
LLVSIVLALWIAWCIGSSGKGGKMPFPRGVSGLLAGITLVDWLAASFSTGATFAIAFLGLFLMAIVFQRVAPAT